LNTGISGGATAEPEEEEADKVNFISGGQGRQPPF